QPRRQRRVLERISPTLRRAVGRVWVPEVHVQEPPLRLAIALQPLLRDRKDLIGALQPALAGVVNLAEPRIPVPRRMTLAERADRRRLQAKLTEAPHPVGRP